MAKDSFLPHQLTISSRLVFSRGITALGGIASLLVIIFRASVTALVPLWAIGVFLSFTLSQVGMAHRWWKIGHLAPRVEVRESGSTLRYEPGWKLKLLVNGFGVCTAVVTIVFAAPSFEMGPGSVILIPTLVAISRHPPSLPEPGGQSHFSVVEMNPHQTASGDPSHQWNTSGTLAAKLARVLSNDITAVYISIDPIEAESIRKKWEIWGEGVRLVILESPYRLLLEPLLAYIGEITAKRQPKEIITIVVPQFVPQIWWHNLLHTQTATWLRFALLFKPGIVITDVPYQVE
jgi:hypothetical protein